MLTARFDNFAINRPGWSFAFDTPCRMRVAHSLAEVPGVLAEVDRATARGLWAVLALAYETAPIFDAALRVHVPGAAPLAAVMVYASPCAAAAPTAIGDFSAGEWTPCVSRADYDRAIATIQAYIAAGDTYQVNYTFPLRARFRGDALAWYQSLGAAQRASYCAWLDLGRYHVISLSPELFFRRHGTQLESRPMKGTLPRGRWLEEDNSNIAALHASVKNRAENLMIVDMVRNDLGRVATLGSVHVPVLFEVERYATVLQMTSTVRCACAPERTTSEILAALFPCGSVTGAPKVRTMEIIHELEPFARGMYTGAIGVFMPGGDCLVNVPIRTITLDTQSGEATFNVGGGITTDSSVGDEYEECLTKTAFLTTPAVDVGLLESLLLEDGIYPLIERHLQRLQASAHYFDMTYDTAHIRAVLDACARAHPAGAWKVRLVLSCAGRADCTAEPRPRLREPWRVGFARMRVDSRDRLLYHKTTQRARYEAARRERPDCDDVILSNERGDVTEASIANIVIERDSRKLTPPLSAGLLPGVFRAALLASGAITEAPLRPDDLRRADGIWLINAVRGWVPATLVDG